MQRLRVADKSRTRVQVQNRQSQLVLGLVGPVGVEGVRNGVGPGYHHGLPCAQRADLGHQAGHGTAVDDLSGHAPAQPVQGSKGFLQCLGSLGPLHLGIRRL